MEIDTSIDVNLPVRSVYNEWTMFEEFPKFMEGVEHVEQLTPDRLHWVAKHRRAAPGVGRADHRADPGPADRLAVGLRRAERGRRGVPSDRRREDARLAAHGVRPAGVPRDDGRRARARPTARRRRPARFKHYIESLGHEAGGWRGSFQPAPSERPRARQMASKADHAAEMAARSPFEDALAGAFGGSSGAFRRRSPRCGRNGGARGTSERRCARPR